MLSQVFAPLVLEVLWSSLVFIRVSRGPILDSEGNGLPRVWTQAHNQPFQGSVLDPRPTLIHAKAQGPYIGPITSHSPQALHRPIYRPLPQGLT